MADQSAPQSSGNATLSFIVGMLVVIVAVLGYLVYTEGIMGGDDVSITIEGAGTAIEDAAAAVVEDN